MLEVVRRDGERKAKMREEGGGRLSVTRGTRERETMERYEKGIWEGKLA